ncbi:hypothetical protein SAMN05660642_01324 [Geodermatophilus siccatus]|uniref:Uncharacterized protein n=1 Tax=Geodermatophilus siccatus TaxID=1137991 RepID=A0A1G9PQY1_9ACTN|nr:hypothetical protein [Geodermatophilus siccatus]SDM01160.1 hypothetical protein SAMN05660642_01324 [Geodermatophilus siccatus]
MDENDGYRWDDDQLMTLLAEVLDPEADRAEAPTSAAQDHRPAELSLEDVVAAGRAAFCWLDVVVTMRDLARHLGSAAGASTPCEPGSRLGHSPTGSTTT